MTSVGLLQVSSNAHYKMPIQLYPKYNIYIDQCNKV